jgi:hypothetical protein
MHKSRIHSVVLTALVCGVLTLPAWADPQIRIVRLSDVHGTVQIDKNAGLGFENAFANLPVTQGTKLRTRENGRAEIEFEDGSTLRVIPNTTVEFSVLGTSDDKRLSTVTLVEGRAYVNWLGKKGDGLTLNFAREKVETRPASHFRVASSSSMAEIATFKNELEVVGPSGTTKVEKKKMVTFNVADNDEPALAKKFDKDSYDEWDKQSVEYHDEYSKNNSTPYGYGYSDLGYYGGFSNIPGYGMLWQPYLSGVGWNPYMDGAWSWYPSMGYLWASAYPWGWMPYYYGNWMYVPGFGWGWQAGGWNGWRGGVHYVGAASSGFRAPVPPKGVVSTVVVGRGGPVSTNGPAARTLVVRSGSAGLGIARGAYGNLHELNSQVGKSGSVALRPAPQFAAHSASAGGYSPAPVGSVGSTGHASASSIGHAPPAAGHK